MAIQEESATMFRVSFEREGDRWRALVERATAADGKFVYAVKTTGVFCRPSCASRRPLRQNVEFFATNDQAERAGYRACLRCKPKDGTPLARVLTKACRLLEGDAIRSEDVAAEVGLSAFHFSRVFKKHMGVTPQEYRRRVLAERAKDELATSSVTEAAFAAGYSSSSRFYEGAARELGMRARDVKSAIDVKYTVRACSLGRLLVAWTDRGACDVAFGDTDAEVVVALQARFPSAKLARVGVPAWVDAIVAIVESRSDRRDVPLDIRGTAFQERVWRELRRIPAGETRSYAEVARTVGGSARAVGAACANNRLAVVVPCHRVVRSDGAMAGYRWGIARKEALLKKERG